MYVSLDRDGQLTLITAVDSFLCGKALKFHNDRISVFEDYARNMLIQRKIFQSFILTDCKDWIFSIEIELTDMDFIRLLFNSIHSFVPTNKIPNLNAMQYSSEHTE